MNTHTAAKAALTRSGLPSLTGVAQSHESGSQGRCGCGNRWSLEHVANAMRDALFAKEAWT